MMIWWYIFTDYRGRQYRIWNIIDMVKDEDVENNKEDRYVCFWFLSGYL